MNSKVNKILSYLLLLIFLTSNFSIFGQTRRNTASKIQPSKSEKKAVCDGGWSGVVTFKKILKDSLESDEPGIRKAKDRIKHKTSRDYDYTARAVVDGTNPQNPSVSTNVSFTDNDLKWGEERVWDTCNSRESGHWFIIQSNDDSQTQAQASGPARSFGLHVDEASGTYSFNIGFPDAKGTYKRDEKLRRSGHCQPKNNEPWDRNTNEPTTIKGESFSVTGEKLDPKNPDTISGSKIWGDDGTGQVRSFIFQVTWSFTRCPQKLLITDLKFEHPKFPDYENWKEIVEQLGTIDGNRVRIKTKVLNMSGETKFATVKLKETYKGNKYNGARPDESLPESETSIRLEAGEERELEYIWNTEGQSWFDDGRPHLLHRIKAEIEENGQKKDEKEKPLNIAPKPVVLVHGLWSNANAWIPLYPNLLTVNHSYGWKAFPVGEKPEKGKLNTGGAFLSVDKTNDIYANADELAKYIKFAQEDANAWHVDIVAHSMGGLISRLYIHKLMPDMPDNRPLVKHLVMLGTPNAGSPCADTIDLKFKLFGERVQAIKDLKPENVAIFNQHVNNRKRVKFSALVGNPIPLMCGGYAWNDGVVSVESAKHGIEDFAYSNDIHTELTDGRNFSNFVKPHLVTGPKGTYPLPVKSDPNNIDRWKMNGNLQNPFAGNFAYASYGRNDFLNENSSQNPQNFTSELKLSSKQKIDIEVPVESASDFGITFLADQSVSVSLINEKGFIVSKNVNDSPLAKVMFRSLFTKTVVAKGVWKLRIENTSDSEQIFMAYSWSTENSSVNRNPVAE